MIPPLCLDCQREPCICDWFAYENARDERQQKEQADTWRNSISAMEYERIMADRRIRS